MWSSPNFVKGIITTMRWRCIDRYRLRRYSHVVVNSRYTASAYGLKNAHLQYPPLSDQRVRPNPQNRDIKNVAIVGRIDKTKGVSDAIQALSLLPDDYNLTIAGEGPDRARVQSLAQRLGVAHRIEFTGWVTTDSIYEILASAGVLLVPSLWDEPFGAVGGEAFRVGTPAIAYDVGGISEWCIEPAGTLVPRGDIESLSTSIRTVASDEESWNARSRACLSTYKRLFDPNTSLRSFETLLSHCVLDPLKPDSA